MQKSTSSPVDKWFVAAISIHLLVAVLRGIYVVYGPLSLHGDEAQYWTWTANLDWSYYSKPPLIAYCNLITQWLLGHSMLSVRINAIICGMIIGWVTYLFTCHIYHSQEKAFWASMLVFAMPFYFEISKIYTTDSVLLLFWLLSSYFFWKALENNKTCHWLAFGLCLGIGSLGKYAMLFFIPIIFLYLTLYNKKTLSNPMLYVSIVIGIMIFSPVIYWNIQHQFIGFKHLQHLSGFENVTNPTEWSLKNIFDFFLGQLLIMSPLFLVCYYHIVRCRKKDAINSYFILPILFIWTIFLFISIIKKHEANVNWTMFVYVPLPIMLASYIVDAHRQKTARVLTSITIFLFLTTLTVPAWTNEKVNKVLPPAADPLKKLSCWKEIAQQVNSVCKQHKDTQKLFVFTEDYMLTSQLLFYMYPQQNIYFFNNGSRMCQNQLWKGIEQFSNKGYDGILVECNTIKGKSEPANLPINVATAFHRVTAHKRTVFYYRGEPAYDVDIYYLKGFTSIEAMTANHY